MESPSRYAFLKTFPVPDFRSIFGGYLFWNFIHVSSISKIDEVLTAFDFLSSSELRTSVPKLEIENHDSKCLEKERMRSGVKVEQFDANAEKVRDPKSRIICD